MSSDVAATASPAIGLTVDAEPAAHRTALRLGFGVTLGCLLGALSGTALFFMPPLLAAQFLATMRRPPALRDAAGLVLMTALFAALTLFLTGGFVRDPLVYVLLLGLVLFLGFLLDSAGKAMPASLLLTFAAIIPLAGTQSLGMAIGLAGAIVVATVIALLATWVMFAIFPAAPQPDSGSRIARQASPKAAFANTAVLLPLVVWCMIGGRMSFVLLIVSIAIIRAGRDGGSRAAMGLLLGNFLGGLAATIAYGFVTVQPSMVFFLLVVLLVGLTFGVHIAAGDALTPLFGVALMTFLILLGLGVSPLPMESGEAFGTRLLNVMLAGLYTVGALSLLPGGRRA
jgi:hypothetical protein